MAGTIRERGPGRWQLQVYVDGRRRARTIRGTRRDAERALPEFIVECRSQSVAELDHTTTVAELLGRWQLARRRSWAPSTAREAARKIDRDIVPAIGDLPVTKLRAHHLDALYAELLDRGLGARTVHHVHALLRSALNQAVRWDLIATNPAVRATPPRPSRTTYEIPTGLDVRSAIAAIDSDVPFAAFIRLASTTGARRGQLVALRWSDLDLNAGLVRFERAISVGHDGPVEKGTKSDRSYSVALGAATVAAVRRLKAWQAEQALACGSKVADDGYLFSADPAGRAPWHPNRPTQRWRRLRDRLGLDGVRLHDLRHAVATQLLAAGVDPVTVAHRLGHSSPNVTLAVYSHLVPARDQAAAEHLDAIIDAGALGGTLIPRDD